MRFYFSIICFFYFISFFAQKHNGVVLDSLNNPVQNARICLDYLEDYDCRRSNRNGEYSIRLRANQKISIVYRRDSTRVRKIYQYKEDLFDGNGYLVEIENIENKGEWKLIRDSLRYSKSYPIKELKKDSLRKRNHDFGYNYSKVLIEEDSAILLKDYDYVKGRLGIDLNLSASFSEHLQTPDLQQTYVQGRPINGQLQQNPAPEPFSFGPNRALLSGINVFDANNILGTGYTTNVGLNIAYQKRIAIWNLELSADKNQGIFEPNQSDSYATRLTFKSPLWSGKLKAQFGIRTEDVEMPLSGNNYMNVLFGAWNSPFHFNAEQNIVQNNNQLSASDQYNNPYFLLDFNRDERKKTTINSGLDYSVDLDKWTLGGNLAWSNTSENFDFGQIPNSAQVTNPNFFERDVNENLFNFHLFAEYRMEHQNKLKLNLLQQINTFNLEKDLISAYSLLNQFPNDGTSQNLYDENINRYTSIAEFIFDYGIDLDSEIELRNELKQSILFSSTNEQSGVYQIENNVFLDSRDLIYGLGWEFGLTYAKTYSEPELYSYNLNFNSLNQNLENFLNYTEPRGLFINQDLEEFQEKEKIEIALNLKVARIFSVLFNYYHFNIENAFAPMFNDSEFQWENVANYHQNGLEITLEKDYYFLNSRNFKWDFSASFHTYKNETDEILINQERVPFFGFNEVSKNFIVGEAVGVIVGNDYQHDQSGNLIIGTDGFPLVDNDLKVIADPNPDFTVNIWNKVEYKNFGLSFNFDWQKGGQIWNGTQNTLNYFGRSQLSAEQRNITGFVFDGVDVNGSPNTTVVDFANPANSVDENRWVRYGILGVASEAIEDASYFRLQNLTLFYKTKERKYHHSLITQFKASVFVNNLWISSDYNGVFPGNGLFGNASGKGLDYFNSPQTRTYGISLQFKF